MDIDGPCAVPKGTDITESISVPLFNLGMMLLCISFYLALGFYNSRNELGINNRSAYEALLRKSLLNNIDTTIRRNAAHIHHYYDHFIRYVYQGATTPFIIGSDVDVSWVFVFGPWRWLDPKPKLTKRLPPNR